MSVTKPPALVLDFDGTVTAKDVGDEVCDRFAPAAWRDIDERWVRREISLPEAQRGMWGLTRGTRDQMETYARQVAALRPGLEDLIAAARERGYRVVVASGGFDFYILPVLAALGLPFDAVHCNGARFFDDRMEPLFNQEGLSCASCAVCKGRVCERERAAGAPRVVFAGDGSSDRCAVGQADAIAAVRGGELERALVAQGVPHVAFEDLREVIGLL